MAPCSVARGVCVVEKLQVLPETKCLRWCPEVIKKKNYRPVYELGELAIQLKCLGINDHLTHLYWYLNDGETALVGIRENAITDIAERLKETPFVNHVDFKFTGNDFVSAKDNVSMCLMTKNNLQILKSGSIDTPILAAEIARAEIEAREVTELVNWFENAAIDDYLVFESLPIGKEKNAISRIYRKKGDGSLEGCFVCLYNPSVEQFNKLRAELGAGKSTCETEQEILENHYKFRMPESASPSEFINFYTGVYDQLLHEKEHKRFSFGLENKDGVEKQDGIEKVRKQTKLISIYLETIQALASSRGQVTPEIMQINEKLGIKCQFKKGQTITIEIARDFMNKVIFGITSAIDKASDEILDDLENSPGTNQETGYAAVSYYSRQAEAAGETYASQLCTEYNSSNLTAESTNDAQSDYSSILQAFRIDKKPNNFGKPKIDVCRIRNCPSRGNPKSWWPDKTLVGGCDICCGCHKIFGEGKSPENIYAEQNRKKEEKSGRLRKIKKQQADVAAKNKNSSKNEKIEQQREKDVNKSEVA